MYLPARGTRLPGGARLIATTLACALIALVLGPGSARSASSGQSVSVTVASASYVDATGCPSNTNNITQFGTQLPAQSLVMSADCIVVFGSSNDSASLHGFQADQRGKAMVASSTGQLDTRWDSDGKVITPYGGSGSYDHVGASVEQSDGKVVAAGSIGAMVGFVRYSAAGAVDGTYGASGFARLDLTAGDDAATDAQVLANDQVLFSGFANSPGAATDSVIGRVTTAGALDGTFGTGGTTIVDISGAGREDQAVAIAVQSDGKPVVAGWFDNGGGDARWYVARFTAAGALDTTFDGDGIRPIDLTSDIDKPTSIAVQRDGRIVAAGYRFSANSDTALVRLNTDGSLDTSFSGDGIVTDVIGGSNDEASGLTIDAYGKIIVSVDMNVADFTVVRYKADGSRDTTFDGDGIQTVDFGYSAGSEDAHDVAIAPDGGIVVIGDLNTGTEILFGAAKLTSAGALDTAFDTDGKASTSLITSTGNAARHVLMLTDGRIMVSGSVLISGTTLYDFALVEYSANAFPDYASGTSDWSSGSGAFGACLRQVLNGASTDGSTWPEDTDFDCADGNADPWRGIPANADLAASKIARSTTTGNEAATAKLRWGIRIGSTQPAGAYSATVVFEVRAPNV